MAQNTHAGTAREHAAMSDAPVHLSGGLPETVLPPADGDADTLLADALSLPESERLGAIRAIVADHPRFLAGWATLGDLADVDVEAYAYYRVGYHRGLDTLRANGWRGSGYVRWKHETNRGFLRALDGLRRMADAIGEADEAGRCDAFLHQLDPAWDRRDD